MGGEGRGVKRDGIRVKFHRSRVTTFSFIYLSLQVEGKVGGLRGYWEVRGEEGEGLKART